MHAMLSDRTARERYLRETPWADERQDFEACEARRILNVAERPEDGVTSHQTPHGWQGFGGNSYSGACLVDALAAFLAAPDPAAYLARRAQAAKVRESILRVAAGFESHA